MITKLTEDKLNSIPVSFNIMFVEKLFHLLRYSSFLEVVITEYRIQ